MFKATKFNICVIGMIVGTTLISLLPFMQAISYTMPAGKGVECNVDIEKFKYASYYQL